MKRKMNSMTFKKALFALAVSAVAGASHAAWPEKPITLIIPYSPGGLTDVVARTMMEDVGKNLGQPIITENRAGAGGKIGLEQVKRAPKDGYTIALVVPALMVTLPLTDKNFGLAPLKDFEPITIAVDTFTVLVLSQKALPGVGSLKEFIAYAKGNPGKLNYATPGAGTSRHFDNVIFAQRIGFDPVHIPYKGEAPALTDLASGVYQYMLASQSAKSFVDAKRIVPIAVASAQRVASFPNIPTFRELGVDFTTNGWVGFVAPAGTPVEILDRLNNAMGQTIRAAKVNQAFVGMGYLPVANTRREFRDSVEKDTQRYAELVRTGAVKIEN
jgi:tripartite-type tricarboxylate transporter receptor subunit TctC